METVKEKVHQNMLAWMSSAMLNAQTMTTSQSKPITATESNNKKKSDE